MTYAVIQHGMINSLHAEDPSDNYHPDIEIIEITGALDGVIDDLLIEHVPVEWNGNNFSMNLDSLKKYMRHQVKEARKYKEADGIWVDGKRYHSDRESIVLIQGSKVLFDSDPSLVISFKADPEPLRTPLDPESAEGNLSISEDIDKNADWVEVDATAFAAIHDAMLNHVSKCFKAEKAVNDQITAASSQAALVAMKPSTLFDTAFDAL